MRYIPFGYLTYVLSLLFFTDIAYQVHGSSDSNVILIFAENIVCTHQNGS